MDPKDGSRLLLPLHQRLLGMSAIAPEVAEQRGYWSATRKGDLLNLGFKDYQARTPALVIPVFDVTGAVAFNQVRPDSPRSTKNGKPVKYETPAGVRMVVDVPPAARATIGDPSIALLVTEGIRKADAAVSAGLCCVALLGVYNWRGKNAEGGLTALACWESIALKNRDVLVVFDSDASTNPDVSKALDRFQSFLESRGAKVQRTYLPPGEDGAKVGLDDYLAAGHTAADLEGLTSPTSKNSADTVVNLDELLRDVAALLRVYVMFSSETQLVAVAPWVVLTHIFEQFETTPYLSITSPEKRSGKTRLLDVLELVAARAWRAVLPSEAVVFRKIARDEPTLLLDEVDAIYGPKAGPHEGLRAILNAGHRRGASVPRCVGEGRDLVDFPVYCPKALAGIGDLPDTVADRSIPIRMRRRAPGEKVDRFRYAEAAKVGKVIRERLEIWAQHADLRRARPEVPAELNDRVADGWEPLLAVADAAGGEWPEKARAAALKLHADGGDDDHQSLGLRLLADCRHAFNVVLRSNAVFTENLLEALRGLDEAPWSDLKGKPISARTLAFYLRPYDIRSGSVRVGDRAAKGYRRDHFADAWTRYLVTPEPADPPSGALERSQGHNAAESNTYADSERSQDSAESEEGHTETEVDSGTSQGCDLVTFGSEEEGGSADEEAFDL